MRWLLSHGVMFMCAVAVTSDATAAPGLPALDPRGAAVLPVDADVLEKSLKTFNPLPEDVTILNQCSRETPAYRLIVRPPRVTFPPTQAEISDLETGLRTLLADRLEAFRESYPGERVPEIGDYYRQYSAFDVGGWRVIYVNGFHNGSRSSRTSEQVFPSWRREPAIMCDGGEYYFGVEYYPEAKTFANFSFNGRFEGWLRLVR